MLRQMRYLKTFPRGEQQLNVEDGMQYLKTIPQGEKQRLDVEVAIEERMEGIPSTETMSNMAPLRLGGDGCKQVLSRRELHMNQHRQYL